MATLFTAGCATFACDPDDPKIGKDCYECTRRATFQSESGDPHTGTHSVARLTEECMRERGYRKEKESK